MPSSGSYAFADLEQVDFVTEAFERIGRSPSSLSSNDIDSARRSTNFMFMDWANEGPQLFKVERFSIPLTVGTLSYVLPREQVYILQVFTRMFQGGGQGPQDLMLSPISRAEYAALPYKQQESDRPTQYYLQRTILPEIFPWPIVRADATVELFYYAMLVQQDAGGFTNSLDAPQRWMEAIASGLAARLAVKFAPQLADSLTERSTRAYQRACAEDREKVPLRINIDASVWNPL